MRPSTLVLLSSLVLGACTDEHDVEEENLDDLGGGGKADGASDWRILGTGVAYQEQNVGPGVLIAYGGYSARQSYVAAWATELVDQTLGAADVGHVYIVRGPQDPSYAAREIANSKLRAHLLALPSDAPIYIVAHSSGSFVAHELLGQLDAAVRARISYANLDGGGSGLTRAIAEDLGALQFVYARDPAVGSSQNAGAMRSLAATYAPSATLFEVRLANTGCAAAWCLHDAVITHRPHNAWTFDLARDYTDFVNRPVTHEYLAL